MAFLTCSADFELLGHNQARKEEAHTSGSSPQCIGGTGKVESFVEDQRNDPLQDLGKAEAMKTLRTTVDNQQPQDMLAWVEACRHLPMFERP